MSDHFNTNADAVQPAVKAGASDAPKSMKIEAQLPPDLAERLAQLQGFMEQAFGMITVAEQEIARAKGLHPAKCDLILGALPVLIPVDGMESMVLPLYEQHCRELLTRVVEGGDVADITDAELVQALSDASLRSPLDRTAFLLFNRALEAALPEVAAALRKQADPLPVEPHDGAVDQLRERANRNFRRLFKRGLAT